MAKGMQLLLCLQLLFESHCATVVLNDKFSCRSFSPSINNAHSVKASTRAHAVAISVRCHLVRLFSLFSWRDTITFARIRISAVV